MFKIKNPFSSLPKFELLTRLIFYNVLLLLSVSFIFFLFFLYERAYLTLSQAEEIIVLKSQLAVDRLDFELYEKVKTAAENRATLSFPDWSKVSNPFLPPLK